MIGVGRPRAEGAEVGEYVPDHLRLCCHGSGPVDLGHRFTLRVVAREAVRSATMEPWPMTT